jgi:thymidylate synthase (FAD)
MRDFSRDFSQVAVTTKSVEKIEIESIPVLDKGYVKLIDYMGEDSSIVEGARMSTGKGFLGWEKDAGMLEYMYSNRHTSPFGLAEVEIEVMAPILVFRQWQRHRTQSYSEFSGRYSQLTDQFYIPTVERCRARQDTVNKQGSTPGVNINAQFDQDQIISEQQSAYDHYNSRIAGGMSKELARLNMPVSVYSKMRAKTDLHNWLHFLGLRQEAHAQEEIRVYADAVGFIIHTLFPRTYALFLEYELNATRFSRSEMDVLKRFILTQDLDFAGFVNSYMEPKRAQNLLKKIL